MKTIAFFNNKGGVGKTTLVHHLAWMYADLGVSVVAADLDPQANLTSMFLEDSQVFELLNEQSHGGTIHRALKPLLEGTGDIETPYAHRVSDGLSLLPGDLALARAEGELSSQWSACLDGNPRAFRVISAFWRILAAACAELEADLVLIDVGPNLGALNRAVMVAAEQVIIPLAPDLYSLQGLRNLGPTLTDWRRQWRDRLDRKPAQLAELALPEGEMRPAGYVVLQHAIRLDRPTQAYAAWMERIPGEYREHIEGDATPPRLAMVDDPHCLTTLKHYRSLMPLAQEARKPIFQLRSADGVRGSHMRAVQSCYADFQELAVRIAQRCNVPLPGSANQVVVEPTVASVD